MGKGTTAVSPAATAPKKERKIRTIEEQIADAEAKAKALREKAETRRNKGRVAAMEKRDKLTLKIADLQKQVDAIDAEYPPEQGEMPADQDTAPEGDES
jgi:hypothetical protein